MAYGHEYVKVMYGGDEIEVDKKIAPLLQQLWQAKIDTLMSCENNVPDDYMWIEFACVCDFDNFITILLTRLPQKIRKHMTSGIASSRMDYRNDCDWILMVHADTDEVLDFLDDDEVWIIPSIRFPVKHYRAVLEAIADFNNEPKDAK